MISTGKYDEMTFVRFDASEDFPLETRQALLQVQKRVGSFEYAKLENGKWCIRTTPKQLYDLPLAAISKDLADAAKRILIFARLREIN